MLSVTIAVYVQVNHGELIQARFLPQLPFPSRRCPASALPGFPYPGARTTPAAASTHARSSALSPGPGFENPTGSQSLLAT